MRDAVGVGGVKPSHEAASPVRFAGLVLDLDACMLARDSGEAIPLTRGEFAVLRMLVSRPGRVISRDALLDAFAQRRFEPFDRSVDVLIGKLRRKIEADPKQPRLIVTVPGGGYRFDGLTATSDRKPTVPPSQDDERLAGGGATAAEPPRLSIVVLPFANLSGDPKRDYFVDGVTDSLTTDLSRIRGAFVIGRSTAFTYEGKAADVRRIGREEAVARLRRATEINTNFSIAHFMLAAALARLDRLSEAHAAVAAELAVDPLFTVVRFRTTTQSDNPIYLAQHQRVCDSMSKGGVPEG